MHPYTTGIAVFEKEIERIRQEFETLTPEQKTNLHLVVMRDEAQERCLWAIEMLQKAYKETKKVSK